MSKKKALRIGQDDVTAAIEKGIGQAKARVMQMNADEIDEVGGGSLPTGTLGLIPPITVPTTD